MEFKNQYKHPNWQRKRLEVLAFSGFCCQLCGSDDDMLHVHHKRYVKGRNVWEYQVSELSVLCEGCHAETHRAKDALNEIIASLHPEGFSEVVALIAGYCSTVYGPAGVRSALLELMVEFSPAAFIAGSEAAKAQSEICRHVAEQRRVEQNG